MILTKSNIIEIDLEKTLEEKITSGRMNEILLIVPTNRKLRYLKKEIISRSPGKVCSIIHIETLTTISTKLLKSQKHFNNLSEAAASVLLKRSISKKELKYFSIYSDEVPKGTIEIIKNVIKEYKRHGVKPESLKRDIEKVTGSEKNKLSDMIKIYENYLTQCEKLNSKEIGDIYSDLNNIDKNSKLITFRKLFPEVKLTFINGFDEFSAPEIEILSTLADITDNELFINFDYFPNNEFIFSHLSKCFDSLIAAGFKKIEDKSIEIQSKFKTAIRENLFKSFVNFNLINIENTPTKIISSSPEQEIELIAKEIKELIKNEKVSPDRICVSFNLIRKYSPIIRDVFNLYKIPFNLTDRRSLDTSQPVITIINFLEIIEKDFYYKNIFRALSSGFVDTKDFDLTNLIAISNELKIISGRSNWLELIKDKISASKFLENETSINYNKALNDIKKLDELLLNFSKKQTLDNFLINLKKLTFDLKMPYKLLERAEGKEEENIKSVVIFFETLEEFFQLIKEENTPEKKYDLHFFLKQIRDIVSWTRTNVKEKSNYGVQVTTINEIRGLTFDYLFIAGLKDGDFPTRYNPEIFVADSYRKKEFIHLTEERYHFYQALCSWNKKLYLTFPVDELSEENAPYSFEGDFSKIFSVQIKTAENYNSHINSKSELLKYIGKTDINFFKNNFSIEELPVNISDLEKLIELDSIRYKNFPLETKRLLDCKVDSDKISSRLNILHDKVFSATELELYSKCPFRYFLEKVLKLKVFEEPSDEFEAIEFGNLIHSILFDFNIRLRQDNLILKKSSDDEFKKITSILFDIAKEKINETQFLSPLSFFEIEKIIGIDGNSQNSLLYKYLKEERESDNEYLPKFFEASFGISYGKHDESLFSKEPIDINGIKFRGKVDLIEVNENNRYNIIDYKTGKKPTQNDIKKGIHLQLPLYSYIIKQMLNDKSGEKFTPNKLLIYSIKLSSDFGLKNLIPSPLKKEEAITDKHEEFISDSIRNIEEFVNKIKEGNFDLSPWENRENLICKNCSYRKVCRINEVI